MTNIKEKSSLFKLDEIFDKEEAPSNFFSLATDQGSNVYVNSAHDYLSKHVKKISFEKTNHLTSNGRWAMHDLVCWLAKQLDKAVIVRTTYAISADAARLYKRFYDKGIIKKLTYIIDKSAQVRNAKAIKTMKPFDLKFTEIHAKLALISNDKNRITVKGSGNDTQGNRIEDFTIFTDNVTFNFYFDFINGLIN